jgi:hypothetical protein
VEERELLTALVVPVAGEARALERLILAVVGVQMMAQQVTAALAL